MAEKARQYVAIDAKSFYASVECVERHLNPLTTNLVVADESRTEKTICLAVSPALKAHKVPGRPRLFEVIQRIREVNRERLKAGIRSGAIQRDPETREYRFSSASFDAEALAADPSLEVSYIVAPPRMRLYEEYSSRIYATYLKYVAPEDILVYSIDEVFIDVTDYLRACGMSAHEMAMTMVRDVLYSTGITATALNAQVFFAPCSLAYTSLIVDQAAAQGVSYALLGSDTWDSNVITNAAAGKNVTIYITTFYQEGGSPEFDAGIKEWMNANPEALTNNGGNDMVSAVTVMGYDAYFTALQALELAGSTDPAAVNEALWDVDYTGVSGEITFNEIGDANRDSAYIKTANTADNVWEFVTVQTVE